MMELIDAISIRLNEVFGDRYTIYLEAVEQNLQRPCFFIQPSDDTDKNMIANRKYRTDAFLIQFIPEGKDAHRAQFAEVKDKLFDSFDSLELEDGTILPTYDRTIDIGDDMLQFIIRFKYYAYTNKPSEPAMETLEIR